MDDCMAYVSVFLNPFLRGYTAGNTLSEPTNLLPEPEERHFQCDRIKNHEDDHETWIPTYGYVRFPQKTLGQGS